MKLKLYFTTLISISLFLVSCRDQEEIKDSNISIIKQNLISQQKRDTITSFESEPKDPPIKGTHWKIKK